MNPFLMRGPEFLGFFACLIVIGLLYIAWRKWHLGPALEGRVRLSDPLAIARLRNGPLEAIRVASLGLLDAGSLTCSGRILTSAPNVLTPMDPLAAAIHAGCAGGYRAALVPDLPEVRAALRTLEHTLINERLVPDAAEKRALGWELFAVLGVLGCTAVAKILYALSQHRSNVFFLVILAGLGLIIIGWYGINGFNRLTTRAGRMTISHLSRMFSAFNDRQRSKTLKPEERRFAAAIFGGTFLGSREAALWRSFSMPAEEPTTPSSSYDRDSSWSSSLSSSLSSSTSSSSYSSSSSSSGCGSSGSDSSGGGGGGCGGCGGGGGGD